MRKCRAFEYFLGTQRGTPVMGISQSAVADHAIYRNHIINWDNTGLQDVKGNVMMQGNYSTSGKLE